MIDGLIVLAAALVFDIGQGLYALIGLAVTGKTIDLVQVGIQRSKNGYDHLAIMRQKSKAILEEVDRGVTRLTAQGGYTKVTVLS